MNTSDHTDWGTGGGRGEGAGPSGWDGFGWSDGSGASSGSARDRARAMWARSMYVGRSAWTAPSLGQRIVGVLVLALIVGLAVLIIVPAMLIGVAVIALAAVYALVRGVFRSFTSGGGSGADAGRKNVRVMGERH